MAVTYPYSLAFLADILPISSVKWDIRRNDELSGTGDGRVWQAELAPPLWSAEVTLAADYHNAAEQIAAKIRKLHGAQESLYLYAPQLPFPQADPDGSILGSSTVVVNSVAGGRNAISLKGLPAAYVLTCGDKVQIAFSNSPVQNYFCELSDTVTADGSGVTGEFEIFPHVPVGVAEDDAVTLKKAACRGFIMPGTHNPGTSAPLFTSGAGFTFMERRR